MSMLMLMTGGLDDRVGVGLGVLLFLTFFFLIFLLMDSPWTYERMKALYTLSNMYFSSCCNFYSFAEINMLVHGRGGGCQASSNKLDILAISQMLNIWNNMHTSFNPLVSSIKIKSKRERILNYHDFPLLNSKWFDTGFMICCSVGNNITSCIQTFLGLI